MQAAGMAIMESFDADIHDNTFSNVKYGIRISVGGGNNNVYDNVFDHCSACEYLYQCIGRQRATSPMQLRPEYHNYRSVQTKGLFRKSMPRLPSRFSSLFSPLPYLRLCSGSSVNDIWLRTARFVDGVFTYQGSDAPEASPDGRPSYNNIYDNTFSNTKTGVKIKEGDNNIITGEMKSD